MSELLDAAKAVIYDWDKDQEVHCESVHMLCAAVERAEKQESVGFDEYWESVDHYRYCECCAKDAWTAAQKAERERIIEIIVGLLTENGPWIHFSTLKEKIDEVS